MVELQDTKSLRLLNGLMTFMEARSRAAARSSRIDAMLAEAKELTDPPEEPAIPDWLTVGELVRIADADGDLIGFEVYEITKLDEDNVELANIETGKKHAIPLAGHRFISASDIAG